MKRNESIGSALVLGLCLLGCDRETGPKLTEVQHGSTHRVEASREAVRMDKSQLVNLDGPIQIHPGQELILDLPVKPEDGWHWDLELPTNEQILSMTGDSVVQDEPATGLNGDVQVMRFLGVAAGTQDLYIGYLNDGQRVSGAPYLSIRVVVKKENGS